MSVRPREKAKGEGLETRTALSASMCVGVLCSCVRVGLLCRVRGMVCFGWRRGCCWCCGGVCVLVCSAGGAVVWSWGTV